MPVPDHTWQWVPELTVDQGDIFVLEVSSACVHIRRKKPEAAVTWGPSGLLSHLFIPSEELLSRDTAVW